MTAIEREFVSRSIPYAREKELSLCYKGELLSKVFRPDFICYDVVIVEVKAVLELSDTFRAQVMNYQKAANMELGILVNFGHYPKVEIERMACSISPRFSPLPHSE